MMKNNNRIQYEPLIYFYNFLILTCPQSNACDTVLSCLVLLTANIYLWCITRIYPSTKTNFAQGSNQQKKKF